ncbi:hypothetical protein [Micromonospora coxensis]|uniref:Uncharacterized protein n=1 Tax=Micromonospora coxensis TaxID=356852 RepID=A0A1C5IWP5_9ACTN|nr:hypothetical protein [Micromonospora coxensis]SCG62764.1 hypothetical protein GA0070614_3546 [Micromonospora coxensis]
MAAPPARATTSAAPAAASPAEIRLSPGTLALARAVAPRCPGTTALPVAARALPDAAPVPASAGAGRAGEWSSAESGDPAR